MINNIHGVNVGDIFHYQSCYGMILNYYYQVVAVTPKSARVQRIKGTRYGISGYEHAVKDAFTSDEVYTVRTAIDDQGRHYFCHRGHRYDYTDVSCWHEFDTND